MNLSQQITKAAVLALVFASVACGRDTVSSNTIAKTQNERGQSTNNIDRHYLLSYDEAQKGLQMSATFTMSGTWSTTVRLDPPSEVRIDGVPMMVDNGMSRDTSILLGTLFPVLSPFFWAASGTSYRLNLHGSFQQPRFVRWTDPHGQVFQDTLQVFPFTASAPATLNKSGGFTVRVSGPAAPGSSRYAATLTQSLPDGRSVSVSGSGSGAIIVFDAADLARLEPGPAKLVVARSVDTQLNRRGSGHGSASAVYTLKEQTVSVY